MDWLHNHYMHLYLGEDLDVMDLEFVSPEQMLGHFPYLEMKTIQLGSEHNAVQQIVDCLEEKEYVEISLDEFYLEGKHYFNKDHFERKFIIYGYEELHHTFSIAGSDYDNVFEFHELPVNQLIQSLHGQSLQQLSIRSVRINDTGEVPFKLLSLTTAFEDYYYSRQPRAGITVTEAIEGSYWGMQVYGAMLVYLERLARSETFYCVRPFHLLWEHKKCMVSRLQYLSQHGYDLSNFISRGYEDIYETTLILRNILVKYHLEPNLNLLRIAARTVENIAEHEQTLLTALLKELGAGTSRIEAKEVSS
ncbi:hypothetical protein ACE6ED_14810 [Paenibacillus sp. CN-4]|uniref:hypothetical protein n=1 Tax=Paenibacillus nanchangensis TaxID=3348343 RepID=UPI003979D1E6